jgi:SAM-dependent methyltransferase
MTGQDFDEASYYQAHYARALATGADVHARNYHLFLDFLDLQPGERVLDVGSGLGMLVAAMSDCEADAVGVDISPIAVQQAQQCYPSATFVLLDGRQLDQYFEPDSFDAITCIQVLEHIPPDEVDSFIGQLARCLRDSGRLLIDVPVTDNLSDKWLMFRNQYLKGEHKPSGSIDSSFNPTHLWKIRDLNLLMGRFRVYGLEAESVRRLYYVPWILARLNWSRVITYLPECWLEQFLKGSTILFRKGTVKEASQIVQFSAFWSDPPDIRGLGRLRKLLA